jgi:hypothetical protein
MDPNNEQDQQDRNNDEDLIQSPRPRDASHMAEDAEQQPSSNSEPAGDDHDHDHDNNKASSTLQLLGGGADTTCQTPQTDTDTDSWKESQQKEAAPSGNSIIPVSTTAPPVLSKPLVVGEELEDPPAAGGASIRNLTLPSTSKLLAEAQAEHLPKAPAATTKKQSSDPSSLGTVARQFLALLKVCVVVGFCEY